MCALGHSNTLKQWGLRRALWAKLMVLIRPWFFLSRISAVEVAAYPPMIRPTDELTVRRATREDLVAAAAENPDQLSQAFVDQALSRGDYCVAAFDGAQMVAWAWASFDRAPHDDGLWVKVEAPFSYGYKWYTKPDYRGKGIILQLTVLRDRIGAESGRTHSVGFIETHNYASWQASKRLGSQSVGYAGYLKLRGRSYPFRTRGAAQHSFSFVHL